MRCSPPSSPPSQIPVTIEPRRSLLLALSLGVVAASARGGEVLRLSPKTWKEARLAGKELDAIHGDWVLRNDRVIAVIADPLPGRDANLQVTSIGGTLIDFMRRDAPDDQLTLWDPRPRGFELSQAEIGSTQGALVELICSSPVRQGEPRLVVRYRLEEGRDYIEVETTVQAPVTGPATIQLIDGVIAGEFQTYSARDGSLAWVEDPWFPATYGVVPAAETTVRARQARARHAPSPFLYSRAGEPEIEIPANEHFTWSRHVYCTVDSLQLRTQVERDLDRPRRTVELLVRAPSGPVAEARCTARVDSEMLGSGLTDQAGRITFEIPRGPATIKVDSYGRSVESFEIEGTEDVSREVELAEPAWIEGAFTDAEGGDLPCGIQIVGRNETPSPEFFPETGDLRVRGTIYTPDGRFRQALRPGQYTAMASRGPEYDIAVVDFQATRGGTTRIKGKLVRSVDTAGWIAADLHGHSSPSGDTYASPYGRVLSLACTGVEFAPRTEHNRIETFDELLVSSGLRRWLTSSPGIELTGDQVRVGHNIAFPLTPIPHTQGNGAPAADEDPVEQIRRLAEFDSGSEKLVILCHPALVRVLYDRDRDGEFDGGYAGILEHADAVEIPPLERIFDPVGPDRNRAGTWMQMINQGIRKPGVMSGDQHSNAGGGLARTYVKSGTDDPARLRPREIARQLEAGHALLTSGPFLEARVVARLEGRPDDAVAIPGDEIRLQPRERATLELRVQCANWYDIDRVQVFKNGRPEPRWNFTRATRPTLFREGPVRFEHRIELDLDGDAHLIVCAVGEEGHMATRLPLVTPRRDEVKAIALTNPIFIDTDGDGFTPNGDDLGSPLPLPR